MCSGLTGCACGVHRSPTDRHHAHESSPDGVLGGRFPHSTYAVRRVMHRAILITISIRSSSFCLDGPRCPEVKIAPASLVPDPSLSPSVMSPGVYPYLGASIRAEQLRPIVRACGGAVVPGKQGVRLAAEVRGVMVDPAMYDPRVKPSSDMLFDCDEWLMRQQAAGVPLFLTDTPRIRNRDRSTLRKALARWDTLDEPTLVVLPIENWWLREGLSCLTEEVQKAGRPVALVLLHRYNGLDAVGAISGLLTLIAAVRPLPVVLLRCDISAVGAVAYGSFAGFVGWSATTRHGPLPIGRPENGEPDEDRDDSPGVFVPALHTYFKASKLPAFARRRNLDVLRCDDPFCRGSSLLRAAELSEVDVQQARMLAYHHNVASTEQIARRVLSGNEPRDAWWEVCRAGANVSASLGEDGISLPAPRWLRQWLELGSPSHDPETVG